MSIGSSPGALSDGGVWGCRDVPASVAAVAFTDLAAWRKRRDQVQQSVTQAASRNSIVDSISDASR
jgi:hypothetical protein